jgi:hypothetical protein
LVVLLGGALFLGVSTAPAGADAGPGLVARPGATADGPSPSIANGAFRVRIKRPALAHAAGQALQGAARRLQAPACNAVFGDFKDAGGRTLQAALDALGQTGPGYLSQIGFYDGQGHARCLRGRTLAITAAGSRAVWICPQFALDQLRDPGLAEAVILHEALHSLGLGEDPPSASEITARVIERCGR